MAARPPSRRVWTALGLALAAAAFASQVAWHRANAGVRFLSDDISLYALEAWCEHALRAGLFPLWLHTPLLGAPYPPLVPTLAALVGLTGHRSQPDMLLSQAPFWALSIGAAWWVSHRRYGPLPGGFAALVAASLLYFPNLAGGFYTEPAVAAFTLATLAALDGSEGLRRPGPAALVGLLAALGMLSKWSFAFFVAPAILASVAWGVGAEVSAAWAAWVLVSLGAVGSAAAAGALARLSAPAAGALAAAGLGGLAAGLWRAPGARAAVGGLALASVVGLAVAGPWYYAALPDLRAFLAQNLAGTYLGNRLAGWEGLTYSPAALVEALVPLPFVLLAGVGALRSFLPGEPGIGRQCVLVVVSACVVLGLAPYGNSRYIAPAAVLFAPLAAAALPRGGLRALWGVPVVLYAAWHLTAWMDLPWNAPFAARVQATTARMFPYVRSTQPGAQVRFPGPPGPNHPLWLQPMLPAGLQQPVRAADPIAVVTRSVEPTEAHGPTWTLVGAPAWLADPRVLGGFLLETDHARPATPVISLPPAATAEYLPRIPGVAIVATTPGITSPEAFAACQRLPAPEGLPTPLDLYRCDAGVPVTLPADPPFVPWWQVLPGAAVGR